MSKATCLTTALLLMLAALLCPGCIIQYPAPPTPTPPPPPTSADLPTQDTTPPQITVTSSITETTGGKNEITFKWTSSDNNTPSSMLTYSYYLKGYAADYSPFTSETSSTYKDLPANSYTFFVKSKDEAGNISLATTTIEVTVASTPPKEKDVQSPIASTLLLLPNSEVSRIAVSSYGDITYALDSINAGLYKSEYGGYGWADISSGIPGAATWDAMSIAPDDHNIIAVATNSGNEVYLSADGGANFFSTQLTGRLDIGERIKCISVSSGYGNNLHELAIGTSTGNGNGKVWVNVISGFQSGWYDLSTGDTFLYIGTRDLAANSIIWNSLPGYPVEICLPGQDTPGTPLTYADLALPSDYLGSTISKRHVYACWSDNPPGVAAAGNPNDDVYRIDDIMCYRLQPRPDVICSLAHYGPFSRGKLLAGTAKSVTEPSSPGIQIYYTSNPQSQYPTWQRSQKPPSGSNDANVAWSPDGKIAYCGTSGIQSAFSRSTNNGLTWNQIGLIDN